MTVRRGDASRLQPKRIGARGLNDPSLLGRHPEWPPPVSRFTAIRFLPPLRAFVLSCCLRCCFFRGANACMSVLLLFSPLLPRFASTLDQFFPFAVSPHQTILVFSLLLLVFGLPDTLSSSNEYICSRRSDGYRCKANRREHNGTPGVSVIISGSGAVVPFSVSLSRQVSS